MHSLNHSKKVSALPSLFTHEKGYAGPNERQDVREVGMAVSRYVGKPVCWSAGMLVGRYAGKPVMR